MDVNVNTKTNASLFVSVTFGRLARARFLLILMPPPPSLLALKSPAVGPTQNNFVLRPVMALNYETSSDHKSVLNNSRLAHS